MSHSIIRNKETTAMANTCTVHKLTSQLKGIKGSRLNPSTVNSSELRNRTGMRCHGKETLKEVESGSSDPLEALQEVQL